MQHRTTEPQNHSRLLGAAAVLVCDDIKLGLLVGLVAACGLHVLGVLVHVVQHQSCLGPDDMHQHLLTLLQPADCCASPLPETSCEVW